MLHFPAARGSSWVVRSKHWAAPSRGHLLPGHWPLSQTVPRTLGSDRVSLWRGEGPERPLWQRRSPPTALLQARTLFIRIFLKNLLTVSLSVDRAGRVSELSSSVLSCKCFKFCWPSSSQGKPPSPAPCAVAMATPLPFKVWNATFHKICTESRLIIRKGLSVSNILYQ